jgi:enhancing lycopene biosynthesis protein 2
VDDIDGLIIPGGFGAAKNLCDFAIKGENCTVDPVIEDFILKRFIIRENLSEQSV